MPLLLPGRRPHRDGRHDGKVHNNALGVLVDLHRLGLLVCVNVAFPHRGDEHKARRPGRIQQGRGPVLLQCPVTVSGILLAHSALPDTEWTVSTAHFSCKDYRPVERACCSNTGIYSTLCCCGALDYVLLQRDGWASSVAALRDVEAVGLQSGGPPEAA